MIIAGGIASSEKWLRFLELPPFSRRRKELGFSDDDVRAMQITILLSPASGVVIGGTGGVRKLRFSKPGDGRGKRGSFRLLYVYFQNAGVVALVTAYAKNEQADINSADKRLFKQMITLIEKSLQAGNQ